MNYSIIDVTAENVEEKGVFCIKDRKADGFRKKVDWFKQKFNEGLTIKIAEDEDGNQIGFIEHIPAENSWRPINADNYLFIQCTTFSSKKQRNQGIASDLIIAVEEAAKESGKDGICTISSKGSWMADKSLFEKNGFNEVAKKDRFELMVKEFGSGITPSFIEWDKNRKDYKGWHLIYADQFPWHEKSVNDLSDTAKANNIKLNLTLMKSPEDAQNAPTGYGVFNLIKDGTVLADHYISKTRFENIIKKELA